ncbi:MAG: porin, partial [Calditrichaceae bacterium]
MKHLLVVVVLFVFSASLMAQDVEASKAKNWSLSGRVQLQHLYDNSIDADAAKNNNGFRMRRTRLQVKAKLTDWVSGKVQIEVRDNSPRLKDAEAKAKLFNNYALRLGQFKVPVWREELRSSGSLYLVERSHAAEFLVDNYLSARHIGLEVSGSYENG